MSRSADAGSASMRDPVYGRDKLGILRTLARLRLRRHRRRAVGMDVAPGELQFFRSALTRLLESRPDVDVYMFYRYAGPVITPLPLPPLDDRIRHIEHTPETFELFVDLDLYITTEQFIPGPPTVYTLTLFHGQPAKGLTFRLHDHDVLAANDALFLYGPLQRRVLDEHLALTQSTLPPHLSLFEIGYTKSDRLLRGEFQREPFLSELGLDPSKRTVIYAPAFNDGASMQEMGPEIVAVLSKLNEYNILAKLAIDCLTPELVGGVDWYRIIGDLEAAHPNFRLVRDLEIDRALAASDVLITCVSSVGYEFLALGRPVVFIDIPKFYEKTLPSYFPGRDVSGWSTRAAVNGGRSFGPVVKEPVDLPATIREVLDEPDRYPRHKADLPDCLLYNPGRATEAAVAQMGQLLDGRVRSGRAVPRKPRLAALKDWLLDATAT